MKLSDIFFILASLLATTRDSIVAGQTVTYTFPQYGDPRTNYGLCVKGASYASATSTAWDLTYDMVSTNFGNGVRLWGESGRISTDVDGNNNDCKGGIYLQPSSSDDMMFSRRSTDTSTIVATAAAGVSEIQICAFVFERSYDGTDFGGNWVNLNSDDHGFEQTQNAFGWMGLDGRFSESGGWTYCKDFQVEVDDVPTILPPPITYTFPSMGGNKIAHGLCVKGAHMASITNTRGLEYGVGSLHFKRHVPLWGGGSPFDAVDLDFGGTENDHPCLGGIYLQPSAKEIPSDLQSIQDSTKIEIIPASGESTVLLCALLFEDEPDSMGDWNNLSNTNGFTEYPDSFGVMPYFEGTGGTKPGRTYCKELDVALKVIMRLAL